MYGTTLLAAATQGRFDLYGPIHKGLRRAHAVMLCRLGAADFTVDQSALLADLRDHLALALIHLTDEESVIHPRLAAKEPGSVVRLDDQHRDHRASFAMLEIAIRAVEGAGVAPVAAANGRHLYLSFSRLVAEDLSHMADEECETWPLLCALFSDAELRELEDEIVGALDPATTIAFLRQVMPASNRSERIALLGGMKTAAPAPAFAAIVEHAVRPTLADDDRRELENLGLLD